MNEKKTKKLRQTARTSLKSSKLKGPERQYNMLNKSEEQGASEKQAKRAIRVVSAGFGQKPPEWAQRQVYDKFSRDFVRVEA